MPYDESWWLGFSCIGAGLLLGATRVIDPDVTAWVGIAVLVIGIAGGVVVRMI